VPKRLEFLGDAVLNFLSGEFLYKKFPEKPEGELTLLRSLLVDEQQLAHFAEMLNLGSQLRLGKGADLDGGRRNPNLLSCAFESLIGAYFLDNGSQIDMVRIYVTPFFESVVDQLVVAAPETTNTKSRLQEWALAQAGEVPRYYAIAETGPDHAKHFTVEVRVSGKVYGQGSGKRKQEAEKLAARNALEKLGLL